MKKIATSVLALALLTLASSAFAANQVRISQVYSGGGASSGTPSYIKDYVELFNSGPTPVNIGDWVLEYGAAAGNWGSAAGNLFTIPTGTVIQPCAYLLVATGAAGTLGAAVPSPDFTTTNMSMSATSGKVALFNALNSNLACGSELAGTLVDKVAWGTGNCPEVTAVAQPANTATGMVRNVAGMTDTDNNANDFTLTANPVPRNSLSPANPVCAATPSNRNTWGQLKTLYR